MTAEVFQFREGFLLQHRRGLICIVVCVCMLSPHPPLQCDRLLSDMQQRASTNPHCRTERAWLCILMRGGRQTDRQEHRERRTERCCNTERQRARDESEEATPPQRTPPLSVSHRLHLCSELVILPGGVGLYKGILLPRLSLPREEEEVGVEAGGRRLSGGAAEVLSSVLITVLTASKNGRRID